MARIQRYEATDKLTPDDKGYTAAETAGRRIGPLYNQAGKDIEQGGVLQGEVVKASGWPLEFSRFRPNETNIRFNTEKNSGLGRLKSTHDMSNGGPILSHIARQMVQDENPDKTLANFRKRQFPDIQGGNPYGNGPNDFGGGGPLEGGVGGDKYPDTGPVDFGGGGPNDLPNDASGGGNDIPTPGIWDWMQKNMGWVGDLTTGGGIASSPAPSAVAPIEPTDTPGEPGSAGNPLPEGSIPFTPDVQPAEQQ